MGLRIAVVGLGHGTSYLGLARNHPRTELVAVVDRDAGRLANVTASWNVRGFASVKELLAAAVADVAIVALPTPFHAETSAACLDAGLHVLQEKPLCLTDEETKAIRSAVWRSGKKFQVGYEVRSSPLHQSILKHVARGDIGTLTNVWYNQHTMESHRPGEWRDARANMGGKLFDCAVHYLDLIQQWAGAPVYRVVVLGNVLEKTGPCEKELPLSAAIALEYRNGVRGTFNFGAANRFNDDASFGLAGTTGRIMGNPWLPEGAGSYEVRLDGGIRKSQVVFDGNLTSRGHLGFKEQFDNFVQMVLDGGPNLCSVDDAIAIHRQMAAIDRSLATGDVVTLD
jgi:predicted dehydrogenase